MFQLVCLAFYDQGTLEDTRFHRWRFTFLAEWRNPAEIRGERISKLTRFAAPASRRRGPRATRASPTQSQRQATSPRPNQPPAEGPALSRPPRRSVGVQLDGVPRMWLPDRCRRKARVASVRAGSSGAADSLSYSVRSASMGEMEAARRAGIRAARAVLIPSVPAARLSARGSQLETP